jgi:type II secretory pathway pseudopilin PulG
MPRQTIRANSPSSRRAGFTTIELLIVASVLAVVTTFGVLGISKARAAVRLSGAAREYASYIEKARIFSIRRHADNSDQRASVSINDDKTSYDVTMDLDGDGGMDTRTISLPSGITFQTIESISFDWRGRTWNTAGGVTTPNAQVSIRMSSDDDSISIDVTGSGDITIDSQVFDDAVPNVNLKVGNLAEGATPVPTPDASGSATPTPDPSTSPTDAAPTPTPIPADGVADPTPSPSPVATATPAPSPSPRSTPNASPTPTPVPCEITTDPDTLIMHVDTTTTIQVSHSSTTSVSISASSSKASDLQVTPGGSQNVGARSSTSFTVKSKKVGTYSITFSAGCGTKTVQVIIIL